MDNEKNRFHVCFEIFGGSEMNKKKLKMPLEFTSICNGFSMELFR